ncbi:MAG: DUF485 domain-containing protein [Halothiobacillaceae bacterium]|jgi:uncharacterized membrane protein (DUF485 family)|nr:DUF485 domain-containing protein [Halothiobacillaceae bacterium]MDY0049391.1 DUF485 domain-containing protein [Halothiobacillaceae bacterium]
MNEEHIARIQSDPRFHELVRKRSGFAWTLAIAMMVIYYAMIAFIAFNPTALGAKISSGSVISIGIVSGFLVILIAFVLTGIYVRRANSEFDELTRQIKENAQ